jgi:hypothetical protein
MTQKEIDKIYADAKAYVLEIQAHNESFIKSLGRRAVRDFDQLLDGCKLDEKIKFVDAPKGKDIEENCGVFKNVFVDQWATNIEEDSFSGFIYANIKGRWIQVPDFTSRIKLLKKMRENLLNKQ